jgi:uncharacterized repeat protein (TIGR02543 family)
MGLWALLLVLMTTAFLGQGAAAATNARWFDGLLRGPEVALTQPLEWRATLNQTLTPASADTKARVLEAFGRRPLHFEPNRGQTDDTVKFLARAPGYQLLLTSNEAVLAVRGQTAEQSAVVRMQLMGAGVNPQPVVEGLAALPGRSNYYLGNDPQHWQTEVPNFAKVRYSQVYPGVDWVLYGNPRQLEYDFVVAPGADPQQIAVNFAGAEAMRLDANGELAITVAGREVLHSSPTIYQVVNGERQIVAGGYVLRESAGNEPVVGFEIAAYDRELPLVIDPLVYFTFVGGAPDDNTLVGGDDYGYAVAVDAAGVAYITGSTSTNNANIKGLTTRFPITSIRLNPDFSGGTDAFVTRMDAAGTIIYSTYFGGNAYESGYGIAVDGVGNAYITGYTNSDDFPLVIRTNADSVNESGSTVAIVTNSPLPVATPGNFYSVTFTATAPTGATFSWALENLSGVPASFNLTTGGVLSGTPTADEAGVYNFIVRLAYEIPSGVVTVVGTVRKTFQLRVRGATALQGTQDAFVARINASGTFGYSTYLGGTGNEAGYGIAVDTLGQAYVTGYTSSANAGTNPVNNFPGANFPGITTRPSAVGEDTFIVKVAVDGSSLIYSTLTGAAGNDRGQGIVLDAAGTSAYITGFCTSTGLIGTEFCANTTNEAAFIAKVNATGAISYSATLNGPGSERGLAIARDDATGVYITGYTSSASGIATTGAYDTTFNGPAASQDAFAAKYTDNMATAFTLTYATYLGGYANDVGYGITVDSFGNAYVAGETYSPDFPMVSPDDSLWAKGEAFLSRLNADDASADPPINAGSILTYSSFWGGAENDSGRGIAKDFSNNVYMVGYTNSPNAGFTFGPITPYRSYSGGADAFAAKFSIPVVNADFSLAVQLQGGGSGLVSSIPEGIGQTAACQIVNGVLIPNADCSASYPTGTVVTLTAVPTTGFLFVGWSGSGSGACAGTSTLTCVVTMDAAKTVVASFSPTFMLTVSKGGTGNGTVASAPVGIPVVGIDCSADCQRYATNTSVLLTATAKSGSVFSGWSGSCEGTVATCQVLMNADKTVTANFAMPSFLLTVSNNSVVGSGTVTSIPAGISCGTDCTKSYVQGTTVILTAVPNAGFMFAGWSGGACSGLNLSCMVTMTAAMNVTATFSISTLPDLIVPALTFSAPATAGRTVSFALQVKNQGAAAAGAFRVGLYLSTNRDINPATDTLVGNSCQFSSLSTGVTAPCSSTFNLPQGLVSGVYYLGAYADPYNAIQESNKTNNSRASVNTLTAYTLGITKTGTGSGTVTSVPSGITCGVGANCTAAFLAGATATLIAAPAANSALVSWTGCTPTVGKPTQCTVLMNATKAVTANFGPGFKLTVVKTGTGTVNGAAVGINCGTICTAQVLKNRIVSLTAAPATGWQFAGWTGCTTATGATCSVTMSTAKTVTATFKPKLTVIKTGSGTVTSVPAGINCGTVCIAPFNLNSVVTLTAKPVTGQQLKRWVGCTTTTGATCTVNMTAAKTVQANFGL